MTTLHLGKGLEEKTATCNFCGEEQKLCVRGSVPLFGKAYDTEFQQVIDGYEFEHLGFFNPRSIRVITGRPRLKPVVVSEQYDVPLDSADICRDCIKQLAKLL